jgi:hypothetical protein
MKKFIGVKVVEAEPMKLGEYNIHRGWTIPPDENPETDGYLVKYPDGYISWCPKGQFEEANRLANGMTFGHAIEAAKKGSKIARAGWNGKGMWVSHSPGHAGLKAEDIWTPNVKEVAIANGGDIDILPYFNMKTADNKIQCGWLASQSDMLADDWMIVE